MKIQIDNKPITIIDLVKQLKWKEVKRALDYHYPEDSKHKNNYKPIFDAIKTYKKRKHKDENEYINISVGVNYGEEERYYSVNTNKYSLSFRAWKEVANIPIDKKTLEYNLNEEIVAHFLWEITFYGNEKDMNKTGKELGKRAKEVQAKLGKKKKK